VIVGKMRFGEHSSATNKFVYLIIKRRKNKTDQRLALGEMKEEQKRGD